MDNAQPLVPVTPSNKDDIRRVNDTNNRTARTAGNAGFWSAVVYALNRWTTVDVTAEDLLILLPVLTVASTYAINWLEYRGLIPSTKKPAAEIAAPVNDQGQIMGQVKP